MHDLVVVAAHVIQRAARCVESHKLCQPGNIIFFSYYSPNNLKK
jgi:hypothetical protein